MKKTMKMTLVFTISMLALSAHAEGQMDNTQCEYTSESNSRNNPKADAQQIQEVVKPNSSNAALAQ